ncbi:MAG: OB-fold nucleic acid binding domain-containing protein [Promethearchaeota archaeon]
MSKEDPVITIVLEDLKARYKNNIIAIYGIGSYFDEEIPDSWIKDDIDIVVIAKSVNSFPKVDWTEVRFHRRKIEGKEIWIGFNTLEGFQKKETFNNESFSNYAWSALNIKCPENSTLLYGNDIRTQIPDIKRSQFDFGDILARGLYHLDKSLGERDQNIAMREFSKGVFKISFYFCIYFSINETFRDTRILQIGNKLKEICKNIRKIEDILGYFEETIIYRNTGYYITEFEKLRKEFINFIVSLLKTGGLHKKMTAIELRDYLTTSFNGFPHLIHALKKYKPGKESHSIKNLHEGKKTLDIDFQSVNVIGTVKEIGNKHYFERVDGSKGTFVTFLLEDQTGIVRVVIWNDEVINRLFRKDNITKNSTVEIINGYIKTGYKDKVELHIGKYGDVVVHKIFSPTKRLKKEITKSQIIERLKALAINETKVSKVPCHYCGLLCSPSAKRCPKCGEPLTFEY